MSLTGQPFFSLIIGWPLPSAVSPLACIFMFGMHQRLSSFMDYISIFSISIFISFHPFSSSKIEIEDADGLYLCHRIFSLMDNFSFILAVVQRRFDGCDDSKGSQRIASQQMKETEGKELATVD